MSRNYSAKSRPELTQLAAHLSSAVSCINSSPSQGKTRPWGLTRVEGGWVYGWVGNTASVGSQPDINTKCFDKFETSLIRIFQNIGW